jgi:hypothetical protein
MHERQRDQREGGLLRMWNVSRLGGMDGTVGP